MSSYSYQGCYFKNEDFSYRKEYAPSIYLKGTKITFQSDYNQHRFICSIDRNDMFCHMYCSDPYNLSNIWNTMLEYQYLIKVVLNFKAVMFCLFVCLILFFTSTQQSFSYAGRFFLGLTSTKLG